MELEISREQMPDGIGAIKVSGELDLYTAPRLKEELLATLGDGALKIIVDMSGVNFIDSSALGVLIGGVKRLKPKDGRMVLVIVDDNVNWIFRITGLNNVFDIYATREDAVASFS
jgi:anti-sigma B factor antagonist